MKFHDLSSHKRLPLLSWLILALLIFGPGCSDGNKGTAVTDPLNQRETDQTDFVSQDVSDGVTPPKNEDLNDEAASGDNNDTDREIEEADLIKVEGDNLYLLNSYKGLVIVDLSNDKKPTIAGRAALVGQPVEMYFRDGYAYIILSEFSNYGYYGRYNEGVSTDIAYSPYYSGGLSKIVVVDVRNQSKPSVISEFKLDSTISDTRIVGDVLYAVAYKYDSTGDQTKNITAVVSYNLADPGNLKEVERQEFPGISEQIHVTQDFIFISQTNANATENDAYQNATVQIVDIADADGDILLRGNFTLQGYIADRFKMDWYNNIFRVVTFDWNKQVSLLQTVDVSNPDQPQALGKVEVMSGEQLFASRFDGERAYIVTYYQVDPLWVIDLSNPAEPKVAGKMEVPGWATYIEPRGERLISLGVDNSDGNWRAYVALVDVANPAEPKELVRQIVGQSYSWSEANNDYKAFKIIDELSLIALPISGWINDQTGYLSGVQLLDFTMESLQTRGFVENAGSVNRVVNHQGTLLSISNEEIASVDITDRDNPIINAKLALVKNIKTFKALGSYGLQLVESVYSGLNTLEVVELGNAEQLETVLASLELDLRYATIIDASSKELVLLGNSIDSSFAWHSSLALIDIADPRQPKLAGRLDLADYTYYSFYQNKTNLLYGNDMVRLGGTMALKNPTYYGVPEPAQDNPTTVEPDIGEGNEGANPTSADLVEGEAGDADNGSDVDEKSVVDEGSTDIPDKELPNNGIQLFDLSDPTKPQLGKFIEFAEGYIVNLHAVDGQLIVTTEEFERYDEQKDVLVRFYLNQFDVSDAQNPKALAKINIPGTFIRQSGDMVYTLETKMNVSEDSQTEVWNMLYALKVKDGKAYLKGSLRIDNSINQMVVQGDNLYLNTTMWNYWYGPVYSDGSVSDGNSGSSSGGSDTPTSHAVALARQASDTTTDKPFGVLIVSLADAANLAIVAEEHLSNDQYPNFLGLEGNFLFAQFGWQTTVSVYDLAANPDSLTAKGTIEFPLYAYDLSVQDDFVYTALGYYGVFFSPLP